MFDDNYNSATLIWFSYSVLYIWRGRITVHMRFDVYSNHDNYKSELLILKWSYYLEIIYGSGLMLDDNGNSSFPPLRS